MSEKTVEAQSLDTKTFALNYIKGLKNKDYTGSGVILELKDLSGNVILPAVCLNDDISQLLDYLEEKIKHDIENSVSYKILKKLIVKGELS